MYFFIGRTEDEPHCDLLKNKEEVEKLMEDYPLGEYTYLKELPSNLEYFPSWSCFLMKGEVVIPKAKEVVTKFEID